MTARLSVGRLASGLLALVVAALPAWTSRAEEVDLELVLAVDVSYSVDDHEAALQREGYLEALVHPAVLQAIGSGPLGRIAVTYIEWAGEAHQQRVVDWTTIGDAKDAQSFAAVLAGKPIGRAPATSISALIDFARSELASNRFTAPRRVIDISGDGPNSAGYPVGAARDAAVTDGITINGLPILSARPNPDGSSPAVGLIDHYRRKVIGGPGAFVLEASAFESFAPTLVEKLVREIGAANQVTQRGRIEEQADAYGPQVRRPVIPRCTVSSTPAPDFPSPPAGRWERQGEGGLCHGHLPLVSARTSVQHLTSLADPSGAALDP